MLTEQIIIDKILYNLYTITVFKGTPAEVEATVASERLGRKINSLIAEGRYTARIRDIDSLYSYSVPESEEGSEESIIEFIEDAMRYDMDIDEVRKTFNFYED